METGTEKTYNKRKETVEPVIVHIRENLGFRTFLTRGLNAVKSEFKLLDSLQRVVEFLVN